jgi:acyl-homoserine lactone acylase PvdQ
MHRPGRLLLLLLVLSLLAPAVAAAQGDFDVTVRRTAHGIPHIEGKSFGDIAYGYGHAFAQDNICVIADQYVTVSGERSKFFGRTRRGRSAATGRSTATSSRTSSSSGSSPRRPSSA